MEISGLSSISGLDVNGIVSSAVQLRTNQLNSPIQNRIQQYSNNISGLGTLSSYLSKFKDTMTESTNFSVNKTQNEYSSKNDTEGVYVETTDDVSEDEFDIEVVQTAQKSKVTSKFSRDFSNNFHSGTINFDLGDNNKFSVTVNAGDSLETIRRNINESNPFGMSATLVNSSSGYVLTLNSDFDFTMDFEGELKQDFENVEQTKTEKRPAIIKVNGVELQSDTNDFDGVQGLKIHANFASNLHVAVTQDSKGQEKQISDFVGNFNKMIDGISSLTKRNTYTDGVSNNDGGLLAGNSNVNRIRDEIKNSIGNEFLDLGISFDKTGKLQYKSTDLSFAEKQERIKEMFSKMEGVIDEYLGNDSIINKEKESINNMIATENKRLEKNNINIQKYQDMMYRKYNNLDNMIQNANTSIQMINSLFSSGN